MADPTIHRPRSPVHVSLRPRDAESEAVPFDMRGVEFGHHGHDCTFETLLRRHDIDAPEAPGLDTALRGLSMVCSDAQILALTRPDRSSACARARTVACPDVF